MHSCEQCTPHGHSVTSKIHVRFTTCSSCSSGETKRCISCFDLFVVSRLLSELTDAQDVLRSRESPQLHRMFLSVYPSSPRRRAIHIYIGDPNKALGLKLSSPMYLGDMEGMTHTNHLRCMLFDLSCGMHSPSQARFFSSYFTKDVR